MVTLSAFFWQRKLFWQVTVILRFLETLETLVHFNSWSYAATALWSLRTCETLMMLCMNWMEKSCVGGESSLSMPVDQGEMDTAMEEAVRFSHLSTRHGSANVFFHLTDCWFTETSFGVYLSVLMWHIYLTVVITKSVFSIHFFVVIIIQQCSQPSNRSNTVPDTGRSKAIIRWKRLVLKSH